MIATSRLCIVLAACSVAWAAPLHAQSSGGSSSGGSSSNSAVGSSSSTGLGGTRSSPVGRAPAGSLGGAAPGGTTAPTPIMPKASALPGSIGTRPSLPGAPPPKAPPGNTAAGTTAGGVNTGTAGSAQVGTASGNAVSSTDPSSAATGSATSTTGVDPDNPGTAANQQGTASATSGGIAGIAAEAGRRRNADPRCRDVLAHKDYFTAQVVLNCQAQVGGTTGTATDRRDLPTGSLGSGLKPIDRPAEVQRGKEVSDNKAVKGICSNC